MDQAMDLINGIVRSKADESGVEVLRRQSKDAIEQVRIQMVRALESKAERQETTALANHFISLLQQQPTKEELKRISAALAKTDDVIAGIRQTKADNDGVALLRSEIEEETRGTVDGIICSIDALKRDSIAAIEQVRIQMLQTLESKAEREETTALSNHFISLLQQQPTKEELNRISAALTKTDDVIASVRQTKADNDDLALLRGAIEKETRGTVDGIQALMSSKADESAISRLHEKIDDALGEMTRNAEIVRQGVLDETKKAIELLNREKTDQSTTDAIRLETKGALEQISIRVRDTLGSVISGTRDLKRNVLDQERRLGLLLEEARKRFPDPISPAQLDAMLAEEEHQLDAMYASFEDKFRGTRSDIRQRQAIYLPYIREAKAGTVEAPVVDLGCGRGEWLELLNSEGLSAQGVDRNRIFLAGCRELDLDVTEQDAISFLQQRKPNSVGVVTSFHLIEHLPHKKLISLIDETLRVLRPGGVVIFETPNPKNLIVAGCNFYLDPTHRHPLPPDLSRYLLEARGFCDVEILEIHPFGSDFQITEGATKVKDALNQYLFSAQDYAVIARKVA
jgi:O-antigen chain-terminating methyltransferase